MSRRSVFPITAEKAQIKQDITNKLLAYLADPDTRWRRTQYPKVAGMSSKKFKAIFPNVDLAKIEKQALEHRRQRYAHHLATVDYALIKKATAGDVSAIRLCYQRFEAWSGDGEPNGGLQMLVALQELFQLLPADLIADFRLRIAATGNVKQIAQIPDFIEIKKCSGKESIIPEM